MKQAKQRKAVASKPKSSRGTSDPRAKRGTTKRGQTRNDGWVNRASGHGTARDRRTYTEFTANHVSDIEALQLWRSEDIAARIIEMAPREALRRGFDLKAEDKELSETIMASIEEIGLRDAIVKAGCTERAMGGAAIYPAMDSDEDLAQPLNEGSIGKITALHVLEPRELHPVSYYGDIQSPKFLMPKKYRLVPITSGLSTGSSNQIIHESRLIIFPGQRVTRQLQPGQRPGWGDSILNRPQKVIEDYGIAWSGAAHLLTEFAQGVLEMEGYAELCAQPGEGGLAEIDRRFDAMARARSTLRMMVVDAKDKYTRQQTPISGLDAMLIQFAQRVAAAADMPVTILMGMSPAGLNATGDSDIRTWYDRVAALQEYYRPRIEHIIRLLLLSADGPTQGIEPDKWSIDFHPLWAPTEKERAETRKIVADTDALYLDRMVVSPEDVAQSRWKGDTFSAEMVIDWSMREKQQKIDDKKASDLDSAALDALRPKNADAVAPVLHDDPAAVEPVDAVAPADAAAPADAKPVDDKATTEKKPAPKLVSVPASAAPAAALNGAQVTSLVAVVQAAVNGEISRESAIAMIKLAYLVDDATATALLGPVDFVPRVAEAAPPADATPVTEEAKAA